MIALFLLAQLPRLCAEGQIIHESTDAFPSGCAQSAIGGHRAAASHAHPYRRRGFSRKDCSVACRLIQNDRGGEPSAAPATDDRANLLLAGPDQVISTSYQNQLPDPLHRNSRSVD